jgi:hypothetical protein
MNPTITELDKEEQEQEAPFDESDLEAVLRADQRADERHSLDVSGKEEADDFRHYLSPSGGEAKEEIDKDARDAGAYRGGKRNRSLIELYPDYSLDRSHSFARLRDFRERVAVRLFHLPAHSYMSRRRLHRRRQFPGWEVIMGNSARLDRGTL